MKAHIDDKILLLYGSNTEVELIKTLCDLDQMLGKFYYDSYNEVFFVRNFNFSLTKIWGLQDTIDLRKRFLLKR